jgi:hypothetical protein
MKSINNEKQYKIAEERIEELLSDAVADYEEAQFPVAKPK